MEYFVAGAALCFMSLIVGISAERSIKLNHIEIGAKGLRDNRGMFEIEGASQPGLQEVKFNVKIGSDVDKAQIMDLISSAERRCPGYNSLVYPVKVTTNVIYNGVTL